MAATSSKQAAAYLIDPMTGPEPSTETGLGSHFGSTFENTTPEKRRDSGLASSNPYRSSMHASPTSPARNSSRSSSRPSSGSPTFRFPPSNGENPFSDPASPTTHSPTTSKHHRRTSSLRERFPGDESHKPLDIIRRDSRKAYRSPHLAKRHIPGADTIDRLDPAFGGIAYHHGGPYDAVLLARNTSYDSSPVAAVHSTNEEALRATPIEKVRDAVDHHLPLDGVAIVPPGVEDHLGRTFDYQEGADLMHESLNGEPGYKRWSDKDYDPDDLKGHGEPAFSLDRALRLQQVHGDAVEMKDRSRLSVMYHDAQRDGTLDSRDPIDIAGGQTKYVELEHKREKDYAGVNRSSSLRLAGESLKKRIGSLQRKNKDD